MRCSVAVREAGLDPAGTANNVLGFVLVEWPLPWEAKPERIAELRPVADRAADLGLRLQLVHEIEVRAEPHRVGIVDRAEGPFQSYRRRVWTLRRSVDDTIGSPNDRRTAIAQLALAVLNEEAGESDDGAALPDVLMCSHGARDVCCGSFGMRLATHLATSRSDLVVWRTSHLGGHRFAPTAVTLPDGHVWAYLDEDLIEGIVDRTAEPALAAQHYRGCSAAPPAAQLAERAAFTAEGWSLLDATRSTGATRLDGTGAHDAWCEVERPDGTRTRYEGRVVLNRQVLVPACGADEPTDTTSDLRLEGLSVTQL